MQRFTSQLLGSQDTSRRYFIAKSAVEQKYEIVTLKWLQKCISAILFFAVVVGTFSVRFKHEHISHYAPLLSYPSRFEDQARIIQSDKFFLNVRSYIMPEISKPFLGEVHLGEA